MQDFILLSFLLFVGVHSQGGSICDTLGATVSVLSCSPPFPAAQSGISLVDSNTSYTCKIELGFNFTNLYDKAEWVNFGVGYGSTAADQWAAYGYGYWVHGIPLDTPTRSGITNTSSTIIYGTLIIGPNHIGSYSIGATVTIVQFNQPPQLYCFLNPTILPSSVLPPNLWVVNNDPLSSDITPPLIYSIRTEKSEYKIGESVRTYAYIQDRSLLMLDDAWTAYSSVNKSAKSSVSCPGATWSPVSEREREKMNLPSISTIKELTHEHSSIRSSSSFRSSSFYSSSSPASLQTDGWFSTDCLVDDSVKHGEHQLTLLNIFDTYANGFDNAPFWTNTVTITVI